MRLINTTTLKFAEVPDSELSEEYPENRYAILSHRSGAAADELTYTDVSDSLNIEEKKGYAKFKGFCDLAASLDYQYGWDDTCCINKGDLNELGEAINSMYRWYQGSGLCIFFLEDVGPGKKSLMDSSWFDRGWILQELIGPANAAFYDSNWTFLGMKSDLLDQLSSKTGVPIDVLSHAASPSTCSVARRMLWAAKRTTTRMEDRAYSLLGIFDVNMPLIYGEREKAFRCLQQAIVQQGKDESIFAWSMLEGQHTAGLYAPSLEAFAECNKVVSTRGSTGFSENNGEISINLKTFPHSMESYYALLNLNGAYDGGNPRVIYSDSAGFQARSIHIPIDPSEKPLNHAYGFWLRTIEPPGHEQCQIKILSRSSDQSESDRVYIGVKDWGSAGLVFLEPKINREESSYIQNPKGWSKIRWIKLGFDEDFNPMLLLANNTGPVKARTPTAFGRDIEFFEQAVALGPTSQPHGMIFDNRWISHPADVPTKSYGWADGITILKVDKKKGMSGTLEALNLGIKVNLISNLNPYGSALRAFDDVAQIWTVDITGTHGSDPEKTLKDTDGSGDCEHCIACCCSNDHGRSAEEEESRTGPGSPKEIRHTGRFDKLPLTNAYSFGAALCIGNTSYPDEAIW